MEIRTLVARRNYSLIKYIFFLHSIGPSGVDSIGEEAANSTRNTIYSLKVFFRLACVNIETHNLQRVFRSGG